MSYRYRNANTGDVVTFESPNARLERLPNWSREADPADVQTASVAVPADHETFDDGPARLVPSDTETAPGLITPPSGNASKESWQRYALAAGATESDIKDLTRDQLRSAFGG